MEFSMIQLGLPLIFLAAVFGLGWYQRRDRQKKNGLRLVVSNSDLKKGAGGEPKNFERHLRAVRPPDKPET